MASVIRAPRLSGEAFFLSVPGAPETAASRSAKLHPVEPQQSVEAPASPLMQIDPDEWNLLKAQLASQEALAKQFKSELDGHAETAAKSGYDKGYQAGIAEGRTAGKLELDAEADVFKRAMDALQAHRAEALVQAEDDMVDMVYEAVCKIMGEAWVSDQAARAVVRQIAKRREETGVVTIHFAPKDYAALLNYYAGHPEARPAGLDIAVDENIQLGGCTVETKTGMLQSRLEDQLEQLKALLLAARKEGA
jgi:flagellar assembly protein FliH